MNAPYFEAMIEAMMDEQDLWRVAVDNEIDATPEQLDFATPFDAGWLDAVEQMELDPTRHGYIKLSQCEEYVCGYRDGAHVEDTVDYVSYQDDVEWLRMGGS